MQTAGRGPGQAHDPIAVTGPRLCVVSNDQKGRLYPLGQRLTIGRGVNNDIVTADPRAVTPSSGPRYGAIRPSNPAGFLPLSPGAHTWANPTGAAASFTWRNRYLL